MIPFITYVIPAACFLAALVPSDAYPEGRYISLAPSTTEILFALDAGDDVVGISSYCNYPPEALGKKIVGNFSQPNIEKIVSLRPDIVFCTGIEQAPSVGSLRKVGLKVVVCNPENLEELYSSITEIGRLVGRETQADALVASMKKTVEEVRARAAKIKVKPRVFFEIWDNPLMTAGKGSFIDEMIGIAGAVNVCRDTPKPYSRVSDETVIRGNPDVIIVLSMIQLDRVGRRFGWNNLAAVKNNRVYNDINGDILCRPSPRLVDGLKQMQERILRETPDPA